MAKPNSGKRGPSDRDLLNAPFPESNTPRKEFPSGECCSVDGDGNVSDAAIHDEIMKGVDPFAGNEFLRIELKGVFTPEELDLYYPMPVHPQDTTGTTGD